MADIVSIGECFVEFFSYDRLHADADLHMTYSGDTYNVLSMATRLGSSCGYISKVSDDPLGDYLLQSWSDDDIDTTHVTQTRGFNAFEFSSSQPPGEGTKVLYRKGAVASTMSIADLEGDYITAEDLIKEVGRDSVRFMMLNRSNDVELNFDFEKVTEKSKDNPVFYVQYAYARINSIFRALKLNIEKNIKLTNENFVLNQHEIEILKKISEWPKCVAISSAKLEPHRIPFYLYDLVTLFHSYWNLGNKNKEFRFVSKNKSVNNSRLLILQALSIVIKNGMSILGVSTPKSM